jgi:hypothetical protein
MAEDQDLSPFEDDSDATQILQGLISPAPAQALVASPPDSPPQSGPGESTPLTGSLRTPPLQAIPKRRPDLAPGNTQATQPASSRKIRRGLAGYFSTGAAAVRRPEAMAAERTAPMGSVPAIGWRGAQEARADAQQPGLRAQIVNATNRPQPIGATETSSGRRITQPTDNPAINQALATDAMQEYRTGLERAIAEIPGAKLAASRSAKNPRRLTAKIVRERQPAETVSDYGAAQISVSSPQDKDAVIAAVRKQFLVVRVKDNFAQGDPEYGYRSYSMQLQMPNGVSQELQIVPREIFETNGDEHRKYRAARDAKLAGKSSTALTAAAKKDNNVAMARFNLRNRNATQDASTKTSTVSPLELRKGAAVVLPDGMPATVVYLDPKLKIARVRTAAGKSLTVRRQDLLGHNGNSQV